MSKERFDRIDSALSKLTVLHEETRDQVKVIAEGFAATNQRIDSVDKRLDSVDKRLGSVRAAEIRGRGATCLSGDLITVRLKPDTTDGL